MAAGTGGHKSNASTEKAAHRIGQGLLSTFRFDDWYRRHDRQNPPIASGRSARPAAVGGNDRARRLSGNGRHATRARRLAGTIDTKSSDSALLRPACRMLDAGPTELVRFWNMVASIEYIERVIATYGEAEQANRQTPARVGNTIVADARSMRTMSWWRAISTVIAPTSTRSSRSRPSTTIRGATWSSRKCVTGDPPILPTGAACPTPCSRTWRSSKAEYPDRVHFMLGNHELAELTDFPIVKNQKMLNLFFRYGLQEMYGPATEKVRRGLSGVSPELPLGGAAAGWTCS